MPLSEASLKDIAVNNPCVALILPEESLATIELPDADWDGLLPCKVLASPPEPEPPPEFLQSFYNLFNA